MGSDAPLKLNEASPSVQAHLGIIQNVIQRMGSNSAACKTWCITIVAALLVVIADKNKPHLALLALLPTFLFAGLDVYYLALEKGFRKSYDDFIRKVHIQALAPSDLYSLDPTGDTTKLQLAALGSFAVWGFYVPLLVLIGLAMVIIA
jgi:hypothetical protein